MSTATATATAEVAEAAETMAEVPHLSPSIAKILIARSPMHAWDAHRLGGNCKDEPTEAQMRGRILDRLMFGVGPEVVAVDAPDWRTKAAQAMRDQVEDGGRIPVLAHKLAEYYDAVGAWKLQLIGLGVRMSGESQVRLTWDDGGVPCKGIPDHVILGDDSATIYDLKTCADACDDACGRAMVSMGYDIQHAAYVDGLQLVHPHLAGRVRMLFLFCETARPWAVNVVEPAGTMKALGSCKWRRAVRTWGECLGRNHFPGYSTRVSRIEARTWQLDEAMAQEGGADGDRD
jgi:hypothetical protein